MKISVLLRRGRVAGQVQAYCPDLPGCSATAASEAEALALLERRVADYFCGDRRPTPPGTRRAFLQL